MIVLVLVMVLENIYPHDLHVFPFLFLMLTMMMTLQAMMMMMTTQVVAPPVNPSFLIVGVIRWPMMKTTTIMMMVMRGVLC